MNKNKNEVSDKELENANGGMKIIVTKNSKILDYIKNIIEKVKKK